MTLTLMLVFVQLFLKDNSIEQLTELLETYLALEVFIVLRKTRY